MQARYEADPQPLVINSSTSTTDATGTYSNSAGIATACLLPLVKPSTLVKVPLFVGHK